MPLPTHRSEQSTRLLVTYAIEMQYATQKWMEPRVVLVQAILSPDLERSKRRLCRLVAPAKRHALQFEDPPGIHAPAGDCWAAHRPTAGPQVQGVSNHAVAERDIRNKRRTNSARSREDRRCSDEASTLSGYWGRHSLSQCRFSCCTCTRFTQTFNLRTPMASHRAASRCHLARYAIAEHDGARGSEVNKGNASTQDLCVVALSASAMEDEVRVAKEAGALDYWTKPVDVLAFRDGMRALLQVRRT